MVKAIVTSGYSSDPIMVDFRQYGFKGCLSKPYDPQILGKRLLEVIEKKENSDDRQKKFSD